MKPSIVKEMATALVDRGTDLSNERAVIYALMEAGYRAGSVITHMDDAIHVARKWWLGSTFSEALALIVGVVSWLAVYCALCPTGGA